MRCTHPRRIFNSGTGPMGLLVPCGRCLGCMIQKRTEWAMRMTHELSYWPDSAFITLTYDDGHLPDPPTIDKAVIQRFLKRLRKNLDHPIKYFACGEYGDKLGRPHYHAIIFGLSSTDPSDRAAVKAAWPYCDWHNRAICQQSIKYVIPQRITYVAKYVNKIKFGKMQQAYYDQGLKPPFRLVSSGLGRRWAEDHKDQLQRTYKVRTIDGVQHTLPRYYINRLQLDITQVQRDAYYAEAEACALRCGITCSYDELDHAGMPELAQRVRKARRQSIAQSECDQATRIAQRDHRKI